MIIPNPLLSEKLEIHYWFNDDSHTIDAITLNKSQHEIIALIQEISKDVFINNYTYSRFTLFEEV